MPHKAILNVNTIYFRIPNIVKSVITFVVFYWLSGCAGYEHNRIVAEQRLQEEKLGIPTYGLDNRNDPLVDAVHGWAWWVGSDAVKEALR